MSKRPNVQKIKCPKDQMSKRSNVQKSKCPKGQKSWDQKSEEQRSKSPSVRKAKGQKGQMSRSSFVPKTKCPKVQVSKRSNVNENTCLETTCPETTSLSAVKRGPMAYKKRVVAPPSRSHFAVKRSDCPAGGMAFVLDSWVAVEADGNPWCIMMGRRRPPPF